MNNYAEKLVEETPEEKEGWTAEEFMKTFYPKIYNTPEINCSKNNNSFDFISGEEDSGNFDEPAKFIITSCSHLPESSFVSTYIQDKTKDPLEELGIEVVK